LLDSGEPEAARQLLQALGPWTRALPAGRRLADELGLTAQPRLR
jgi:hypothetical protein